MLSVQSGAVQNDKLLEKYPYTALKHKLNPVIGEYDDPFNQAQGLLTLPLSDTGNCIVYGATGSGKTSLLTALVFSLISCHSPLWVNIYILDFGSEVLQMFHNAPHVGDVAFSYENEKIHNLFKFLENEIETRKQLFSKFAGDFESYALNAKKTVPNILVLINNYASFAEQYDELSEVFNILTREGTKYGIYFVVTANSANSVRYRTAQNFKNILSLQLNDATEYPTLFGRTDGLVPGAYKGRGLIRLSNVFEFQTAHCFNSPDEQSKISAYCDSLNTKYKERAKKIPVLPEMVNAQLFLNDSLNIEKLPLGIQKQSLETVYADFSAGYIFPVLCQNSGSLKGFCGELISLLRYAGGNTIILDGEKFIAGKSGDNYFSDNFSSCITALFNEAVERNNTYKDSEMKAESLDSRESLFIFIIGLRKIMDSLSDDLQEKLSLVLEKGKTVYKMHCIIADTDANIGMYAISQWYKLNSVGENGVFIGDGIASQRIFSLGKVSREYYEEIGDQFGYFVCRRKLYLSKLLYSGDK